MYLKALLIQAFSILVSLNSFGQNAFKKYLISTSYRISTGTSVRYDPLSLKVGYSFYENNVIRLIPYVNSEINPQGLRRWLSDTI